MKHLKKIIAVLLTAILISTFVLPVVSYAASVNSGEEAVYEDGVETHASLGERITLKVLIKLFFKFQFKEFINAFVEWIRSLFSFGGNKPNPSPSGIQAVTDAINKGAKDSNAAIIAAIKEILADDSNSNWADKYDDRDLTKIIWFDEAGLQENVAGELAITLHFGEGSFNFVDVTYAAVKALIGTAVNENAASIYSINIATVGARILNGNPIEADENGDIGWWVEEDLKNAMAGAGGLTGALEAAQEYGIPVEIVTMDGNSQVYRMNFEISKNWSE